MLSVAPCLVVFFEDVTGLVPDKLCVDKIYLFADCLVDTIYVDV